MRCHDGILPSLIVSRKAATEGRAAPTATEAVVDEDLAVEDSHSGVDILSSESLRFGGGPAVVTPPGRGCVAGVTTEVCMAQSWLESHPNKKQSALFRPKEEESLLPPCPLVDASRLLMSEESSLLLRTNLLDPEISAPPSSDEADIHFCHQS